MKYRLFSIVWAYLMHKIPKPFRQIMKSFVTFRFINRSNTALAGDVIRVLADSMGIQKITDGFPRRHRFSL